MKDFEKWRFLKTGPLPGAKNMAIDEALLYSVEEGFSPPVFRLYQWDPPCLSLGYTQRVEGIDLEACNRLGIDIVRRITGGRAVLHDQELTYSLIFPLDHPLGRKSIYESFYSINHCIITALRILGIKASIFNKFKGIFKLRYENYDNNISKINCFMSLNINDIGVNGKKLVGSAQRRLGKAVLHHGSILLSLRAEMLLAVFPEWDSMEWVNSRITSLNEQLGAIPPPFRLVQGIHEGFREGLGLHFFPGLLQEREIQMASRLSVEKYSASWWIQMREGKGTRKGSFVA